MNFKNLLEMCKCRIREFVREPSAFFFVMSMPVLWMAILGVSFNSPRIDPVEIGWEVVGGNESLFNKEIYEGVRAKPGVRVSVGEYGALSELLKQGVIKVIVRVSSQEKKVTYLYDPSDRDALRTRLAVDDWIQRLGGRQDVVEVSEQKMTLPGSRYIDFLIPGLIAFSIMTSSLFGTGAVLVVSRRENLLKRYLVTPMRASDYLLSHVVGRLFMLAVEVSAILIAGRLFFDFAPKGSWLSSLGIMILGAAAFTSFAALLGSRTSNMGVMNGFTNLFVLPMMLLSGVWFSRAHFPDWLRDLSDYLPLTALTEALRKIMLEGGSLGGLGPSIGVLLVFTCGSFIGAKMLFKWHD